MKDSGVVCYLYGGMDPPPLDQMEYNYTDSSGHRRLETEEVDKWETFHYPYSQLNLEETYYVEGHPYFKFMELWQNTWKHYGLGLESLRADGSLRNTFTAKDRRP